MTPATLEPTTGSHRITEHDGKVIVHNVELFCGFDPDFDDPDDPTISKYTPERIAEVIARTQSYMAKRQFPKVIKGHNSDDDAEERPAIGDVVSIGVAPDDELLILGDLEFSRDNFDQYVGNNSLPRRSVEIWPGDGYLSEVALLSSRTPARPIEDIKFVRDGMICERFSRDLPPMKFGAGDPLADDAIESAGARYVELLEEQIALRRGLLGKLEPEKHNRASRTTSPSPRKESFDMYGRNDSLNQEVLTALKSVNLVLAAKFARHNGIADEQFDRQVVTGKDKFGRDITERFGDNLQKHEREATAAQDARDWCTREGITDSAKYKAKYEELLQA